jgi:hypothetical protein
MLGFVPQPNLHDTTLRRGPNASRAALFFFNYTVNGFYSQTSGGIKIFPLFRS